MNTKEPSNKNEENCLDAVIAQELIDKLHIITYGDIPYVFFKTHYIKNNYHIEKEIENRFSNKAISNRIKEIIFRIKIRTTQHEYPFNKHKKFIPFRNRILNIETGELLNHDPKFGFSFCFNVVYDPSIDSSKANAYLESLVEKNELVYLKQIMGQILLREQYKTAYILLVDGNNGKSMYNNVLTEICGGENVSNLSLHDLSERFLIPELEHKVANLSGELGSALINETDRFKSITGGDEIEVRQLYCKPYKIKPHAIHAFCANSLPEITDKNRAFYDRFIIINFNNKFERNAKFEEEFLTDANKSALINIALKSANDIIRSGIKRPNSDIKEDWEINSNTIYKFANELLESNSSTRLALDCVYSIYAQWCKHYNLTIQSKNKFKIECDKKGYIVRKRGSQGSQVETILGVRWKYLDLYAKSSSDMPKDEDLPQNVSEEDIKRFIDIILEVNDTEDNYTYA